MTEPLLPATGFLLNMIGLIGVKVDKMQFVVVPFIPEALTQIEHDGCSLLSGKLPGGSRGPMPTCG